MNTTFSIPDVTLQMEDISSQITKVRSEDSLNAIKVCRIGSFIFGQFNIKFGSSLAGGDSLLKGFPPPDCVASNGTSYNAVVVALNSAILTNKAYISYSVDANGDAIGKSRMYSANNNSTVSGVTWSGTFFYFAAPGY